MDEHTLRTKIVQAARSMGGLGINHGTSGNISARCGGAMLITCSATPYEQMQPEDVASMKLEDERGAWTGPMKPSTEWRLHLAVLRGRPDAGAVVHTHATYCTTLAILRKPIPAVHYMVAAFGGTDVRCAPYATFGTAELAEHTLAALQGRNACLLANHGMVVVGADLDKAMWLAVELETLARQYCLSLQLGDPYVLTDAEIADTAKSFSTYGLQERDKAA